MLLRLQDFTAYRNKSRRKQIKLLLRSKECLLRQDQSSSRRANSHRAQQSEPQPRGARAESSQRSAGTRSSCHNSADGSRDAGVGNAQRARAQAVAREPLTAEDFCARESQRQTRSHRGAEAAEAASATQSGDPSRHASRSGSSMGHDGSPRGRSSVASERRAQRNAHGQRDTLHQRRGRHKRSASSSTQDARRWEQAWMRDFFDSAHRKSRVRTSSFSPVKITCCYHVSSSQCVPLRAPDYLHSHFECHLGSLGTFTYSYVF